MPLDQADRPTESMPLRPCQGNLVAPAPALSDAEATRIGRYKLLQKIGEGGMGAVYMAEQLQPVSRRVALKIIKPGMDSREILARFEAERQALALMDHPNTTRVLDAGTTELGHPYFVMELVKGVPITRYCDQRQLLLKERLELFLPVCQAVQHAHQKGVIHRDIKPSNILVAQYDNRPVPKIIDFGLAKAIGQKLTDKTMFTQYGQILGTIDYMSPEQASFNQLDVDTRSDIYSLGVLLYELLAGETPFDKKRLRSAAVDDLLRIIRQEEPPRPSARLSSHASLPSIAANRRLDPKKLKHLVRGELDWIVMKAMDKERDRRYQTAAALAEDIRRYLSHQAVLACPPSASYQLRKFARRNRMLLVSATAIVLTLLLGLVGTSWALIQTQKAQRQAVEELRLKVIEQSRQSIVARLQYDQARSFDRFIEKTRVLLDQIVRQTFISRSAASAPSESQRELLDEVTHFWQEAIVADIDRSGSPGFRSHDYRVQIALCHARGGDHRRAYDAVASLLDDPDNAGRQAPHLIRIFALCASAAESDPRLAAFYIAAGMRVLRQTAISPSAEPLSAGDPDLAPFAVDPEFGLLLDQWRHRWRKLVEPGRNQRYPASVPLKSTKRD